MMKSTERPLQVGTTYFREKLALFDDHRKAMRCFQQNNDIGNHS